jgi:hypothetical protein
MHLSAIVNGEGVVVTWHQKWQESRPRWGAFSVRAHTDLSQLITDILLYDVVVFPCPEDDDDFARWADNGWDPELLALRITQLGDHAAAVPWDRTLREVWSDRYNQLSLTERENPSTAYDLTASQIAGLSWLTLMGSEDDRLGDVAANPPQIHPAFAGRDARRRAPHEELEVVAAFHRPWESLWLTGASGSADVTGTVLSPTQGVRVRLALAVPEDDTNEDAFHRALDLIGTEDFQHARRRLWSWERDLPDNPGPDELHLHLQALVVDHNKAVERQVKRSLLKTVFLLVPATAGIALDIITSGLVGTVIGAGSTVAIDAVKSRFPALTGDAVRASHHPGSALTGMLSIVHQS